MKRLFWTLLIFTMGTNLPAPLFPLYQIGFHMTDADISLLFATYAVFLLPSLLLVGHLSDQVGRKTMMLPSIALLAVASGVFAVAPSAVFLYAARALQGIATGGFLGACTAFMMDQADESQRQRTTLLASFTTMVGFGLGPGVAGLFIQYVPSDPYSTVFLLHLFLCFASMVAVGTLSETVRRRPGARVQFSLGVPRNVRLPFFGFIAPAVFLFFAMNGTVIALISTFAVKVLHLHNLAIGGMLIFALMLAGGLAQLAIRNADMLKVTKWGLLMTAAGAFVIILSAPEKSPLLLVVGTLIEGIGNGWTFKGSLGLSGQITTAETRAKVVASYYVAAYAGFSIPVFSVGLLSERVGLTNALLVLSVLLTAGAFAMIAGSRRAMKLAPDGVVP